jgi:arginine-tRNA-protein transferase
MAEMNEEHYEAMVTCSPVKTVLIEYRLYDPPDDQPVAVMMVDIQRDGLSAVYSFFDPELEDRSLGTFMVLDCAALAHEMELAYVYLGYYIRDCDKMNYKSRFKPAEVMIEGKWLPLDSID